MSFVSAIEPLLDCMCTALAEAGWEGQCCVNPGMPAFDSCCEGADGGTAWGRLVRAYPSSDFPAEDFPQNPSNGCSGSQGWALQLELGAAECVCFDMCDCAKKAENAANVLGHAEAALQGLLCCLGDGPCSDVEHRIGNLEIGGPEGGCGAFKIDVTVQYFMNCCPPESI